MRLRILERKDVPIYFRVRWNTSENPRYCRNQCTNLSHSCIPPAKRSANRSESRFTWGAGVACEQKYPGWSLLLCEYRLEHFLAKVSRWGAAAAHTQDPSIKAGLSLASACRESPVCARRTRGPADICKLKKQPLLFACQLLLTRLGHFRSALGVSSEGTNSVLCCHIPELPLQMFYSSQKSFLMFFLLLFVSQYQKGI